MENETRHHPRVRGTAGVELCAQEGRFTCRARDMSLAGCYLETHHTVVGPHVQLVFQVPGQLERVACAAQVVRQDLKSDGTLGLALRFKAMDWSALLGLAKIVAPQLG